jgi:drug/metabolite transporter (DMT)-like permease
MSEEPDPARRLWPALWNKPTLLLTLTALMWAGHSIVGRLAIGQISPMTLTCGRWALALAPIVFAARGSLRRDLRIMRPRWRFVVAMGALGFTAFNALFYVAAHRTSALNLSIVQGIVPALVLLGIRLFYGARIGAMQALGAFATMLGVIAIAAQGDWARLASLSFNSGDLMILIACVIYAGYAIGLRNRPRVSGLGLLAAFAFVALATSIPLFALEIVSGGFIWPSPIGLAALAYAALLPSFLAQLFFMRGVELIGPGRAGVFVNLVPLFGALMAVGLLGEPFAAYHVAALGLVVGGIMLAQRNGPAEQSLARSAR